ncbi:MAG: glycosyltransferase family 2 protein [Desulfotignum sp.]|nr:glycosyltransferase family 2 protein [Desulfotignum sp.]
MYKDKKICVVVPAYNERSQIAGVIETMPEYVDAVVVVDDASIDDTVRVVRECRQGRADLFLIEHETNQGCGGAVITGYTWAAERDFDVVVRMDGDGQMNPDDLTSLIDPVATGAVDFAKGNRFFSGKAYEVMPKLRFLGTAFLSLLTKIVSGYWHLSDFQSGYVAISKKALDTVDWQQMYTRYGQPNDQLILLNVYNFKVKDVPVDPVYHVGEVSGIKIKKVIFTLGWLLVKRFFWRLKEKYIIRDFHPLVFFYALGLSLGGLSFLLFCRVFYIWLADSNIPTINAFAAFSSFIASAQFTLFAMWFDMEANKHLRADDE